MGKTTKDRLVIKQKLYIILMLLFCLCITACGKQADTDQGIEDVEESKVIKKKQLDIIKWPLTMKILVQCIDVAIY